MTGRDRSVELFNYCRQRSVERSSENSSYSPLTVYILPDAQEACSKSHML